MDSITIPIVEQKDRVGVPGSTCYTFDLSALDQDQATDLLIDTSIRLSEIDGGHLAPTTILAMAAVTGRQKGF